MDSARKKELMESYKAKPVVGGVYCIECSGNGKKWLRSTVDMEGIKNRFEFAIKIKSAPSPDMRREWEAYGCDSFTFTCLEELKKSETQTAAEFAADVDVLFEIWQEKLKLTDK